MGALATTAGIIICTLSAASAFGAVIGGCILVANRWAERQADEFLRGLLARDREFEDFSWVCCRQRSPPICGRRPGAIASRTGGPR